MFLLLEKFLQVVSQTFTTSKCDPEPIGHICFDQGAIGRMEHFFEIKVDLHGCNRRLGVGRRHHVHWRVHRSFLSRRTDVFLVKLVLSEQGGTVAGIVLLRKQSCCWIGPTKIT